MAITQIGATIIINRNTTPAISSAATSGGTPIALTVPADATMVVIGVSGFGGTANLISANNTFDIGGNSSVGVGGAASTGFWQSALHYILNPATGAQNMDWQWGGAAGVGLDTVDVIAEISYWKGVDTGSPTRDSDGAQGAGATAVTKTLTALTGDLIIACGATNDVGTGNLTFAWSGATELSGGGATNIGEADASLATASPTGNQTVGYTATGAEEFSISVWVFKAAAAAGGDLSALIGEPINGYSALN